MISFLNAAGNLMNQLGRLGLVLTTVKNAQTTLQTNFINGSTGVTPQFNAEPDIQAIMGNSYISLLGSVEGPCSVMQQIAQQAINRVVFLDNALYNQNLTQNNTLASIVEVIRQMQLAGATVLAMNVTATPQTFQFNSQYFANPQPTIVPGNAVPVLSVKRPLDGKVLENSFSETLTFLCTSDSFSGGATTFNEPYSVTGQGAETDLFAFDWPLGSNCNIGINAIDGDTSNGSGNLLTNSNFSVWTGSVPNNFTIVQGGGVLSKSSSVVFVNSVPCMLVTGDGATTTQFQQNWSTNASTQTQYGFNVWMRRGGASISTGTLTVSLVDQNGNVINDNNNVPNTLTFPLTGSALTTSWTSFNGVFRTATILPNQVFINYSITPVNSGGLVYLAKSALGILSQLYLQGPFSGVFAGSIPAVQADYNFSTISNGRGVGGTLQTWQTALFQLFSPISQQNEIIWPSSSVPSLSDQLLT